ncbi:MAG: type III pantothenate kinase [Bacteroidota bacterium]
MRDKAEVILVDIGNSSIKTTEVRDGELRNNRSWESVDHILAFYSNESMVISSVKKLPGSCYSRERTVVVSYKTSLPIKLDYSTPETLGADRIAAAVGVFDLFPERNNLIIDMGTCITMDLVDSTGTFKGGVISPGLKMRMRAMSEFTDQLPDISSEWESIAKNELGKSTKECLLNGSYHAIIHEINSVFKTLDKNFTSLNMILSGGDANFFESTLKAHIFAGSKIVQRGLYRIWKHRQ